jgi:hypothetical protein
MSEGDGAVDPDVLMDSLNIFGDIRVNSEEEGRIRYGSLVLTVAPKVRAFRPFCCAGSRCFNGLISIGRKGTLHQRTNTPNCDC